MTGKLAELYVEIVGKGMDKLTADMGSVRKLLDEHNTRQKTVTTRLEETATAQKKMGEEAVKSSEKASMGLATVKQGLEGMAAKIGFAVAGFQALTGSIQGWVRAGMQGTATGNYLNIQMQFLSREIASVFLPTINLVIGGITRLVTWFRSLTGEQQNLIRRLVEAGAAMVFVSAILPRLVSGVMALVGAIGVGSGGLVPLLGLIVSAMAGIAVGTEGGRSALGGFAQSIQPLLGMLSSLGRLIAEAFSGFAQTALLIVIDLFNALGPAVLAVGTAVVQAGQAIFEAFGPTITALMASIRPMLEAITPVVVSTINIVGQIGAAIGRVFGPVVERLLPIMQAAFVAVAQIVERLSQVFTRLIPIFERVFAVVVRIAETIGNVLFRAIQIVGRVFGEQIATWEDAFQLIVRAVDAIAAAMERVADIIAGIVEGVQAAIDAASDVINGQNGNPGGVVGAGVRFGQWLAGGGATNIVGGTVGQAPVTGGSWSNREDINLAGGRTTSAEQHYRELQSNVLSASIPQQQLAEAQESNDLLQQLIDYIQPIAGAIPGLGGWGSNNGEWT